jgi:hypothetical protein
LSKDYIKDTGSPAIILKKIHLFFARNRPDDLHNLRNRSHIMDTKGSRAVSDAPGDGGGGAENPLVRPLFPGNFADKSFSAGSDKQRLAQAGQGARVSQ